MEHISPHPNKHEAPTRPTAASSRLRRAALVLLWLPLVALQLGDSAVSEAAPSAGGTLVVQNETLPAGSGQAFDFQVTARLAYTQVSAGSGFNCAVRSDSTEVCWGSGAYGQVSQVPPLGIIALSDFSLTDGQSDTVSALFAGDFDIVETLPAGWALDSVSCDGVTAPLAGGVRVTVPDGATVTCTFHNTSTLAQCIDPPDDIVAWWPLDEAAGTDVDDVWDNDNNGVLSGPAGWDAAGKVRGAHFFDGSNGNYVDVPDDPSLDFGTGDFTLSAWIRQPLGAPPPGRGTRTIIDKRESVGSRYRGYMLEISNGQQLVAQIANGTRFFTYFGKFSSTPFGDGQWHHVAATFGRQSGTGVDLYFDGQRVGGGDPAGAGDISTSVPLRLGGGRVSSHRFHGWLDEVQLYARALAEDEIAAIVAADSAGLCLPPCEPSDLIAHWTGDGTTIDEVADQVGTVVGDAHYEPGKKAQAFDFDGSGDRIVIEPGPASGSFTIAAWLYYEPDLNMWPWKAVYARGVRGFWLKQRAINYWESDDRYVGALQVPLNAWSHVALAYDQPSCTFTAYVDGVADVSVQYCGASLPSGANLGIGGHLYGAEDFHGLIDDVRVYSRPLSAAEIQALIQGAPCPP